MFHLGRHRNYGSRSHWHSLLAPFLIPSATAHAYQHLCLSVVYVPVVAAARLECHVCHASVHRCQIAVACEVLGVCGVWFTLGPYREVHGLDVFRRLLEEGSNGMAAVLRLSHAHVALQHFGNGTQLLVAHAHVSCSVDVGKQLWGASGQSRYGRNSHQFAVGKRQVVACKDVAEEVSLEIIVALRCECVAEGLTGELCLHLGSLLQSVIVGRQRVGFAACFGGLASLGAFLYGLLQCAESVQRTGETSVGIEL